MADRWLFSLHGTEEEALRFPLKATNGVVAEFENEAAITNLRVFIFFSRNGIGIVTGHYGNSHRVFWKHVHRNNVVGHELDRVDRDQLTIYI